MKRTSANQLDLAGTPLAKALYGKRQREGLSLARAAKRAGLSTSTLWRMETLPAPPTLPNLLRAAKWLGIEPWELIA